MATGRNLFSDEEGMTRYRKDEVKGERERAYADPQLKQSYMDEVRQDLPFSLQSLTVSLLNDDLWTQPSLDKIREIRTQNMLYQY